MKKKTLVLCSLFVVFAIVTTVYSFNPTDAVSPISFVEIEAMAHSEVGCVNKPGSNDGHCATDGTFYLCENSGSKDCKKGLYPN